MPHCLVRCSPGGFEISARKTYGHVSDGMICSGRELGINDEYDGILVLADGEVGQDARPILGLDDAVLDIAVTPDRGYCLSIRGIARKPPWPTGSNSPIPLRWSRSCPPTARST